jgi:putative membrane protein
MKKVLSVIPIALIILALAGISFAQQSGANVNPQDSNFVKNASMDNQMQIKMGQLASQKGASKEVKDFGQRLASDTTKHNQNLKEIAHNMGFPFSFDIDTERQMMMDIFAKKCGEDFDRAFVSMLAQDNRNHIDQFEKEARDGKDAEIKSFASKELPVLRQHQNELYKLEPHVAKK